MPPLGYTSGRMDAPRTIVVLRYAHVGDIVLTSPAIEAVKTAWPEVRVVYALNEGFGDLVRHDPRVDAVIERGPGEGARAFAARLKERHRPDAFLDLQGGWSNALVRPLSGARRRAVFRRRPLLDELLVKRLRLRPYRAAMTIADRYHAAVEALAGRAIPRGRMRLHVGGDDRARARSRLVEAGIDPARGPVGMSPGANFETKRWPVERYADLAARIAAEGHPVVLTGNARETPLAEAVRRAAPAAVDLTGRLTLGELGGVIEACRAFVANDSGPMHMARALGVPTLAFFGSTDPRQFEFTGHALQYAGEGLPCAPCSLWGLPSCPQGHFRCMLDLPVDAALESLRSLLDGPRAPAVGG